MKNEKALLLAIALTFILLSGATISAQTTEFTYQGSLSDGSQPANGVYDFEFALFDALSGGTQINSIPKSNVAVTDGVFTVKLNFFDEFPGAGRWLEIRVKQSTPLSGNGAELGQTGFTTLSPRQAMTSIPYSIKSLNAENANTATTATNATQLGGVSASQYVTTTDPRMSDARTPTSGSADYIQNTTTQQTSADFNVSGTGTANKFDASTQYNINGGRVLSVAGSNNVFVGIGAGANNTGSKNSFFGAVAGFNNTSGFSNSFFGNDAGNLNTSGFDNSFFGQEAGESNTTAHSNSFFGRSAGQSNTTGTSNSFFGKNAGQSNITANSNSFFGRDAGKLNTTGTSNSFFGSFAGSANTDGDSNSFFGQRAGNANTDGFWNAFFGAGAGEENTTAFSNSFFGRDAGTNTTTGTSNTFLGERAGDSNTTGRRNTIIGIIADVGSDNLDNATAIGAFAQVDTSNSLVLGSINGVNFGEADTNVGIGTTSPTERLHIAVNSGRILLGDAGCSTGVTAIGFASTLASCTNYSIAGSGTSTFINRPTGGSIYFRENNVTQIRINPGGVMRLENLGSAGSTSLCRNSSNEISTCSSSLRYKSNVTDFTPGLELIKRLRPVSFNWIDGGMLDVGLVAEEVAEAEPLLTTTKDGKVEGVKYDRVGVVLVNAVKEQQEQIEVLKAGVKKEKEANKALTERVKALEAIVCELKPEAAGCKQTEN